MDLTKIDHPQSATTYHHGVEVDIDGWKVRLRAVGVQHRPAAAFFASLPEGAARGDAMMEQLPVFLADEVVLGWSNLTSGGVAVPYTRDTAVELFTLHFPLAQAVIDAAMVEGGLLDRQEAEDLGNSRGGSSNGASSSPPSSEPPRTADTSRRSLRGRPSQAAARSPGNAIAT